MMGLAEGDVRQLLDKSLHAYTDYEQQWWKQDRGGRWVVMEPGPGRLLTDEPRHVRDRIDRMIPQRGRRFRSLSRARAFAREIGGEVRRWRRKMPRRGRWRYENNPWKDVARRSPWMLWGCS